MINKIKVNFSANTNKRIIDILYTTPGWMFASDTQIKSKTYLDSDCGFIFKSYDNETPFVNNEILNTYANIIFDTVNDNSHLKFKIIKRIDWNWYHPGSTTKFHQDVLLDNHYSILYNLQDNDGGTEFIINNKNDFYKSNQSEALVFPSKILHRGVAPKKDLNRFALNMVVRL
tara:strand:- start:95 stop:613 length:519 start_codon:yes stop_codon:yes gene_type:complete